jgi:hypothetical protein
MRRLLYKNDALLLRNKFENQTFDNVSKHLHVL